MLLTFVVMMKEVEIAVLPKDIQNKDLILKKALQKAKWTRRKEDDITFRIRKRSIDARSKQPLYRLRVELYKNQQPESSHHYIEHFAILPAEVKCCIIIGAGPAGYFAALELIELGIRPIILERGKEVRERRKDLRAIQQFGQVNPDSNYCFGEGGAGTYSDGKLYTRSHKRGKIKKALELLVEHGAVSDILIDAHPHIGSNKLPKVVANIRETILKFGGKIHFNTKVVDFILEGKKIVGVISENAKEFRADATILATGHSARDIFYLLQRKNIKIEQKPFALGVRIEHPQALIDKIQYRQEKREENLPASSYKLVCQVRNRGVFSFCMCPGGLVVPAATAPGEIVVNGMSMSRRDSLYANSGTVVAIENEDVQIYKEHGVFAGMEFQKKVEQQMFNAGDGSQAAPAQRLTDFVKGKVSGHLPSSSYIPGLFSAPLHDLLPTSIYTRLKEAVQVFGKKMKGYYTEEANVIGTESRTSSPIQIPRNKQTYMHEEIEGLFPCGEGAGYAGGIISAAMDGQNVAKAVSKFYEKIIPPSKGRGYIT